MKARAPLVALPFLALAACGGGESVRAKEAEVQRQAAVLTGWERMFGSPETTIASANQFGFRAPALEGTVGAYKTQGSEIFISSTAVAAPNKASFAATGVNADALDAISFTLLLQDPTNEAPAKQRFSTVIRDFLFQAKAPGAEAIAAAVTAGRPARGTIPGADWALTRSMQEGVPVATRLTVTFTRPDTKSATSSS
jgi:hypothetical protein